MYATPHQHEQWADHVARVDKTVEAGKKLISDIHGWMYAVDLSCGDASILKRLQAWHEGRFEDAEMRVKLGDFAPGYAMCGPIEETLDLVSDIDLFVLSETLEHLDNPDDILERLRYRARRLLLSTPKCSWPDPNPEHLWAWDDEAVQDMLVTAGWDPVDYTESYTGLGYTYQIWSCR